MTHSLKRRNLEPKKWSLFDIVGLYGLYSSGVKMTLKVGLVPMETTVQTIFGLIRACFKSNDLCYEFLNL